MKVLSVPPLLAARAGGVQTFATEQAAAVQDLGVNISIYTSDLPGLLGRSSSGTVATHELPPAARDLDVLLFPARAPRRLAYSPELGRALERDAPNFDVVHIHSLWLYPQYAAFRAATRRGVPYVVSPHGAIDPYFDRRGKLRKAFMSMTWQRRMLEQAAVIHVTTEAEQHAVRHIAPSVPRVLIPCGVRTDQFAQLPTRGRFRKRFLDGYDGLVVLFIGRINHVKGLDVLLRAHALLQEVPARLVIIGPDDEALVPRLRVLAQELGVAATVDFIGPLYGEDRLAALADADAWALPSHSENFGLSAVEALAAGVPVVISPAVKTASVLRRSGAATVADRNPAAIAAALTDTLRANRDDIGRRGRNFVVEHFDWKVVGPQYVEMYQRVSSI